MILQIWKRCGRKVYIFFGISIWTVSFMEENCMMTSWQHKLKRGSFEGLTDTGLPDIKKTILGVSTNVFLLKPSVKFDTPCMLLFWRWNRLTTMNKNCLKLLCNSFITRLNGARIWISGFTLSHNNALPLARDDGSILSYNLWHTRRFLPIQNLRPELQSNTLNRDPFILLKRKVKM